MKVTRTYIVLLQSLLLLVSYATIANVYALTSAAREKALFFLPEEPRNEHKLLLQQLDRLGIERFVPPNTQDTNGDDGFSLWSSLPKDSADIDLVWSIAASPPYDRIGFPLSFTTKVNHLPGAEKLTTSNLLYKHFVKLQKKHGKFFFHFVPKNYILPRDQDKMARAFPEVQKRYEYEMKRYRDPKIYQRFLVREVPANGNEAVANTPASLIITDVELQDRLQHEFKDKTVQVTQYIEPYLLDGHKFNVGFYVAVTSLNPLRVYIYDHALIKIAKVQYPRRMTATTDRGTYNFEDYYPPWDFPALRKLFYEFPSPERPGTNAWQVVKRYLMMKGLDTKRLDDDIQDLVVKTIVTNRAYFQDEIAKLKRIKSNPGDTSAPSDLSENFFDVWKFDFELDDNGKPWLIKIHSNPSLTPQTSVLGTDEAIKKHMLFDLLNLVGVHPQSKLRFEDFFHGTDAKFCAQKCQDKIRTWDSACWSCPGWFPPYVAQRLFTSMHEYARRGQFNLVFPHMTKDFTKFMDTSLSEYDVAFDRYIKSLSIASANTPESPLVDRKVVCIYREHCSGNGDCINGICQCDKEYEGTTCYVPKDMAHEKLKREKQAAAAAQPTPESWKEKVEHLWHRSSAPEPAAAAAAAINQKKSQQLSEFERFNVWKLLLGLLMLSGVLFGASRAYAYYTETSIERKSN